LTGDVPCAQASTCLHLGPVLPRIDQAVLNERATGWEQKVTKDLQRSPAGIRRDHDAPGLSLRVSVIDDGDR
jgi:hypothetical protein